MYLTNEQGSAKDMIKSQGGEMAFQHTNNNTWFKVVLGEALQAGDVISAKMQSRTDAELGLWLSTATSRPAEEPTSKIVLATASSQAWVTAPTYTVTEGDGICGETTFYIYRHTGKSTYFNTFTITREGAASAPVITTQPVGAQYAPNATAAALSVAATASAGNLSYQWYSNSTATTEGATSINGATNATYTPSTANEGKTYYYCVVTDGNGSTTSDIVAIEVVALAPVITTQPVGAKYAPNAAATAMSVVATASAGNLSYQWYSNSTASTEGAASINEATNDTYTPSTANEGTTYYYCVVTDGNGSTTSEIVAIEVSNATEAVVGYTEAININGATLDARALTGADNITITGPSYGTPITDQGSKTVYIDGTSYTNNKSWRKSTSTYDNQYVGYTLTVAPGYKMNVKNVNARIAVADDTYTWYVEILNGAGTQVWKSGERTTTKASSGKIDNVDVSDKAEIQGLTGNVTVNLYVKQGGSTKYFSINYLQLTVETEVDARPTYAMSVSQTIDEAGTVTPDDGAEVTEGESVAFTATPNTEYKFVKWVIDDVDQTTNPYVIENVNATHTAVAHFAKRYTVAYVLGNFAGTLTGKVLCNVQRGNGFDEVYSDDDDNYTIPAYAHKYLYREGYIFDKWEDGDGNTYDSGDVIAMTKDITLTPTWKATSQALSASSTENFVEWRFAKDDMVFFDWQSNDKFGYYAQEAMVNGERITVPMSITKGKVGNYTRTDAIAQTNQNTTFTIPAVKGMTIVIADANTAFSTTTIAGSTEYTGYGTTSISYTYEGDDPTIDIVIGEGNQYLKTIEVTYPVNLTSTTITPAYAKSTYVTTYPLSFSTVEGLKAYIATDASDGKVTLEEVHEVPAGTPLMLIGTAETEYTVPVDVAASFLAYPDNMFVAGDGTTEFDGSTYDYILFSDGLFYQIGSGKVATTKAYLHCDSDPTVNNGSRGLTLVFGGEATGISSVNGDEVNAKGYFNLNGQRVSQPSKGLYIVEGKKVIIK